MEKNTAKWTNKQKNKGSSKQTNERAYGRTDEHTSKLASPVETAQPGDRTTEPDIVMPEHYKSSQRVDLLAKVVITPVCHMHTRLHKETKIKN